MQRPRLPPQTEIVNLPGNFYQDVVGNGLAQIEMTVGFGLSFGEGKCSCTVRLTCNQDEATLDAVGERAFSKAHELASKGIETLILEKEEASRGNGHT